MLFGWFEFVVLELGGGGGSAFNKREHQSSFWKPCRYYSVYFFANNCNFEAVEKSLTQSL